jgi:hypothetical protein
MLFTHSVGALASQETVIVDAMGAVGDAAFPVQSRLDRSDASAQPHCRVGLSERARLRRPQRGQVSWLGLTWFVLSASANPRDIRVGAQATASYTRIVNMCLFTADLLPRRVCMRLPSYSRARRQSCPPRLQRTLPVWAPTACRSVTFGSSQSFAFAFACWTCACVCQDVHSVIPS